VERRSPRVQVRMELGARISQANAVKRGANVEAREY
jgi:hypothetical protein